MKKLNNQVYKAEEIKDFKELIKYSSEKYANNVAYIELMCCFLRKFAF